jgi:uncharacterized protein DUF1761
MATADAAATDDPPLGGLMYHITFNYFAIIVSAAAAFMLGALWYSPAVLGKQWVAAQGHTPADLERMKADTAKVYGATFLTQLVMAVVLAMLISLVGIVRWQGGLKLGLLCWLGFAATTGLAANLFSGKKLSAFLIDAGYQVVYVMLMGTVLAAWR